MNRTVRNQQQGLWLQDSFNAQTEVNAIQQMIGSLIERRAQSLAQAGAASVWLCRCQAYGTVHYPHFHAQRDPRDY